MLFKRQATSDKPAIFVNDVQHEPNRNLISEKYKVFETEEKKSIIFILL